MFPFDLPCLMCVFDVYDLCGKEDETFKKHKDKNGSWYLK